MDFRPLDLPSIQRLAQQKVDDPAQYLFSLEEPKIEKDLKKYSQGLIEAGVFDQVKIVPIPLAKNKVMYRLENMNDKESAKVNNTLVIESMWKAANPDIPIPSGYKLKETSVTGNMGIDEME